MDEALDAGINFFDTGCITSASTISVSAPSSWR